MNPDEMAPIVAAVSGLEQAITGMAAILEEHGAMLAQLLEAAAAPLPEETRVSQLLEALIGRLDRQQGTLDRIETGIGMFNDTLGKMAGPQ